MKDRHLNPFATGNDRYQGYIADVIKRITWGMGAEYEIRLASNGTWDGAIGQVLNQVG